MTSIAELSLGALFLVLGLLLLSNAARFQQLAIRATRGRGSPGYGRLVDRGVRRDTYRLQLRLSGAVLVLTGTIMLLAALQPLIEAAH